RSHRFMLFFLTRPPPLRSTLFPYTTLFRSGPALVTRMAMQGITSAFDAQKWNVLQVSGIGHIKAEEMEDWRDRLEAEGRRSAPADRKSTRLNSSHQIISYAVFCLKKKNKHK